MLDFEQFIKGVKVDEVAESDEDASDSSGGESDESSNNLIVEQTL